MEIAIVLCLAMVLTAVLTSVLVCVYTKKVSVKHLATIIIGTLLLLLSVSVLRPFWTSKVDGYAFKHLEANAKKAVTANELQAWATNVLAHPNDYRLQTNYPSSLRRIHPTREPRTRICTNLDQPYVVLDWTAEDILVEIQVGRTNFVGWGHKWQDGVYFLYEPH